MTPAPWAHWQIVPSGSPIDDLMTRVEPAASGR